MFGTILTAIGSGLKALAIGLGWLKQNSDQNIGKQLQSAADNQATIKEAIDAQENESAVSGLSGSALDEQLRQSATPKS